jgi:hypothetical protein
MGVQRGTRRTGADTPARVQVDLSSLSQDDLHRLLSLARARGQTGLTERLTAELAARRRGVGPAPIVPLREAPRRRGPATAVLAVSTLLGAGLAWGLSVPGLFTPKPAPATPRVMVVRTSAPAAPVAPPVVETALTAPSPVLHNASPPATASRRNACLDLPTPGERLICGYPSLAILDHRLTAAYEHALQTAPDPSSLARDQAAWRDRRNSVWDRSQLNALYEARIGELESVAGPPSQSPPT